MCYTLTALLLQVRGVVNTNIEVGILWFMGGISSWVTCVFELIMGNTFAYCVFGSFGGYYFAFACTLTPTFSIAAGYSQPEELSRATGLFFCIWGVLWFIFLLASLRTNAIFVLIFSRST